jgi:hypothetical protein
VLDGKKPLKCLLPYCLISKIRLFFMMDMYLFYHILAVLLDLLGLRKRNDDGRIRRIFSPNLILLHALILMVMAYD